MRTRAAVGVMADQSPEGDWVDVGGGDSEESHADLFLASIGKAKGVPSSQKNSISQTALLLSSDEVTPGRRLPTPLPEESTPLRNQLFQRKDFHNIL